MSEKKINIEVIEVNEKEIENQGFKFINSEVKVKINDIEAKMVEDDGMTWFDAEDYKTVIFPTAESLLETIQVCNRARKTLNNKWLKETANSIRNGVKILGSLEEVAKFARYGGHLDKELTDTEIETIESIEGIFLDWAKHCFKVGKHKEVFVADYYKEIIQDTFGDDLNEIENKQGLVYVDKKELSEYWFMDESDGIYTYGIDNKPFLYLLDTEDREKAIEELASENCERPTFTKALVLILEEILELAEKA